VSTVEEVAAAVRNLAPKRVVAFTGAGVSAESGIPTFRGAGGLWRNFRAEDLATPEAFARDPEMVWEWYEWRRQLVLNAEPNAAHRALAGLEEIVVVTQNVDGLHARGGSRDVVELHGNIFRVRCTREGTTHELPGELTELPPRCACGAMLRPDVVWFGEVLPDDAVARATRAMREADLVLVIGTSGVVYPAAGLLAYCRGVTVEINPQASALSSACTFAIAETAAVATPPLVAAIEESRRCSR